jgi:hypothetical protein
MTGSVDRVIHVPLSEADWKAFLATQPQPVNWLKERIKEAIEAAAGTRRRPSSRSSIRRRLSSPTGPRLEHAASCRALPGFSENRDLHPGSLNKKKPGTCVPGS